MSLDDNGLCSCKFSQLLAREAALQMSPAPRQHLLNLNALETLKDILLLSEGFWAGECCRSLIKGITQTSLPHSFRFLPKHGQRYFKLGVAHFTAHTHPHTSTNRSKYTHGPLRRASPRGIQSHGEIWPYGLNWIAVIPCPTCFGDVCVLG